MSIDLCSQCWLEHQCQLRITPRLVEHSDVPNSRGVQAEPVAHIAPTQPTLSDKVREHRSKSILMPDPIFPPTPHIPPHVTRAVLAGHRAGTRPKGDTWESALS